MVHLRIVTIDTITNRDPTWWNDPLTCTSAKYLYLHVGFHYYYHWVYLYTGNVMFVTSEWLPISISGTSKNIGTRTCMALGFVEFIEKNPSGVVR